MGVGGMGWRWMLIIWIWIKPGRSVMRHLVGWIGFLGRKERKIFGGQYSRSVVFDLI